MAYSEDPTQAPHNDDGSPPVSWPADVICPLCGQLRAPFDGRVSAVLEWISLLEETTKDLRKAAEALVA